MLWRRFNAFVTCKNCHGRPIATNTKNSGNSQQEGDQDVSLCRYLPVSPFRFTLIETRNAVALLTHESIPSMLRSGPFANTRRRRRKRPGDLRGSRNNGAFFNVVTTLTSFLAIAGYHTTQSWFSLFEPFTGNCLRRSCSSCPTCRSPSWRSRSTRSKKSSRRSRRSTTTSSRLTRSMRLMASRVKSSYVILLSHTSYSVMVHFWLLRLLVLEIDLTDSHYRSQSSSASSSSRPTDCARAPRWRSTGCSFRSRTFTGATRT